MTNENREDIPVTKWPQQNALKHSSSEIIQRQCSYT